MSTHNRCGLCQIDIENLSVYSGEDILIQDINMNFLCGQLTALIGKNGAGKTTLIRAILGERPYTGRIKYHRYDNKEMKRPTTGYVPQQLIFDRSMPVSVLDFMLASKRKKAVWQKHTQKEKMDVIKKLEKMKCEHVMNRRLGDLSGGELQRVLLAVATDPMPDLLILDEPVSGVDASGLDLFYHTVCDLRDTHHMAILLVSHDLPLIKQYADKAVLLDKKVVVQGDVADVFATEAFQRTFGSTKGVTK